MKFRFWNSLAPRKRKFVLWIAGLLLFYAVVGFLILPPIVRRVPCAAEGVDSGGHCQIMPTWRRNMRTQALALSCSVLFYSTLLWGGQALRSTVKVPPAGLRGRITIDEVVGRQSQSSPITKLKIYLLRVEDSRPLVELQDGCRRAMKDPGADLVRAYDLCSRNLRRLVDIVPTLPSVATTETDRDGGYEFAEVPAAGRYYVVGVKPVEGAEPLAMVGSTNKMRAGESVTPNLSANDPSTRASTP